MSDYRRSFDEVRDELQERFRLAGVSAMKVQQTSGYHDPDTGYRLWVNQDRTLKVKLWANGRLTVQTRGQSRGSRWGTPMSMREEV